MSFLSRVKRSFLRLILITIIMLIFAAPFMWLQINYPYQANAFKNTLTQHSFIFTLCRWIFVMSVFVAWPWIINQFSKKQAWSREKIQFWHSQRNRIVGWLIAFELLVCENLLLSLIKLF